MDDRHETVFKIREVLAPHTRLVLGIVCVAIVLSLWVALTWGPVESRRISPIILPSPVDVVRAVGTLHWEHELALNAMRSLKRVTFGFLLAAALAIPLGVAMGAFPKVCAFFDPLVLFGGYVPVVTLVPLTMAWFGFGETQKIGFLTIGVFVFLLPMVVKTIQDVDDVYLHTGYTLGADRFQTVTHILVPIALARIYNHCRFLYGLGWSYIILAEFTELNAGGLGAAIAKANRRSKTAEVFAILLIIVIIAILADTALKHLGHLLFPYEEEV